MRCLSASDHKLIWADLDRPADVAGRLARYRPMLDEASPERRLMREIVEVGLPVGADRIRKILGEQ